MWRWGIAWLSGGAVWVIWYLHLDISGTSWGASVLRLCWIPFLVISLICSCEVLKWYTCNSDWSLVVWWVDVWSWVVWKGRIWMRPLIRAIWTDLRFVLLDMFNGWRLESGFRRGRVCALTFFLYLYLSFSRFFGWDSHHGVSPPLDVDLLLAGRPVWVSNYFLTMIYGEILIFSVFITFFSILLHIHISFSLFLSIFPFYLFNVSHTPKRYIVAFVTRYYCYTYKINNLLFIIYLLNIIHILKDISRVYFV